MLRCCSHRRGQVGVGEIAEALSDPGRAQTFAQRISELIKDASVNERVSRKHLGLFLFGRLILYWRDVHFYICFCFVDEGYPCLQSTNTLRLRVMRCFLLACASCGRHGYFTHSQHGLTSWLAKFDQASVYPCGAPGKHRGLRNRWRFSNSVPLGCDINFRGRLWRAPFEVFTGALLPPRPSFFERDEVVAYAIGNPQTPAKIRIPKSSYLSLAFSQQ